MGSLIFLFFPWGLILQAVAIVHFIRRRPDGYWLWIIIFFGGLGALIYIAAEVIPDAGLMRQSLTLALRHTTTRHAFGITIADRPMMTNVLADMAGEVEAATLMALRVARATDDLDSVEHERLLADPRRGAWRCPAWPPASCARARARWRA